MQNRQASMRATAVTLARVYVFLAAMMFGAGVVAGALSASAGLG